MKTKRAPVGVLAEPRVGVLVQVGAVELRQRPRVLREVRGHPVDDDADAGLMQRVDEEAEVVGGAEPRRRREVRRHLVTPRAAERMLGDRQELDVGEAEIAHVGDEFVGELPVARGPASTSRDALRRRSSASARRRVARAAASHSSSCHSCVEVKTTERLRRRDLGGERHRVGLLAPLPVGAEHVELVARRPTPTPGMNSSQTPLDPSERIG